MCNYTLLSWTGFKFLRMLLAIINTTATLLFGIIDKFCCSYWLDHYMPNYKANIIDFFDDNFPQHVEQVRFLLGECPPGQTLPTIMEEDEEETRQSDTEDGEAATDSLPAHMDTTKSASQSPGVIDIQARSA